LFLLSFFCKTIQQNAILLYIIKKNKKRVSLSFLRVFTFSLQIKNIGLKVVFLSVGNKHIKAALRKEAMPCKEPLLNRCLIRVI